jgi:Raf kinase inhibitor-like YbhB/YbcL family protein
MQLSSTSFAAEGEIPQRFGKKLENVSPQLAWSDPPGTTASLRLQLIDLHPIARGYVHWVVEGIPADTRELAENAAATGMPDGVREPTPYAGPFPPSGTHEYEFTLTALDAGGDVLDTAILRGTFTKQRP